MTNNSTTTTEKKRTYITRKQTCINNNTNITLLTAPQLNGQQIIIQLTKTIEASSESVISLCVCVCVFWASAAAAAFCFYPLPFYLLYNPNRFTFICFWTFSMCFNILVFQDFWGMYQELDNIVLCPSFLKVGLHFMY